ncbi:hypothetical protein FJZ55_10080 [Candidatus Woesearchaeota archaeon]|nr:hypothetical protein [Candidatus Woesearchaeota archaeon]
MNEYLLEARDELKRLEHIIYVSLKYTRTVDVIINALNCIDLIIEAFLEKAKEDKLIEVLPKSPALRATKVTEIYSTDLELQRYLTFYTFLRTILKLPYTKREEFRRHVTFVVELDHATAEINIDNLVNCERFMHEFSKYAWTVLVGKSEDDD